MNISMTAGLLVLSWASSSAFAAPAQGALGAPSLVSSAWRSTAMRFDAGSATVMVRARIIRDSASIGARFGAPAARMTPRRTTVAAADGRHVPALVYDFE